LAIIELKKARELKSSEKRSGSPASDAKHAQVDQPDYGHILDNMIVEEEPLSRAQQSAEDRAQIAFILEQDLQGALRQYRCSQPHDSSYPRWKSSTVE
jgi:hypothetical protein